MRHITALAGGFGLVALLAGSAAAQQPPTPGDDKATARPPMSMPAMHGMMVGCQDHTHLKAEITNVLAKVRDAQTSADPASMKVALGDADRTLAAVLAHFGKCSAMMDKMKGAAPASPDTPAEEHKH